MSTSMDDKDRTSYGIPELRINRCTVQNGGEHFCYEKLITWPEMGRFYPFLNHTLCKPSVTS
jgi:hypothetical protein